jgi:hypothetical protein
VNEPNVREFALREEGQVLSWRRLTNLPRFDLIVQPILRQDYIISAFDYSITPVFLVALTTFTPVIAAAGEIRGVRFAGRERIAKKRVNFSRSFSTVQNILAAKRCNSAQGAANLIR